uniref:glutathione transferase n=1 Tax=Prymnesium polylepis TaxID=72548 RepID=A0A7S4IF88_9EUKA
MSTIMPPSKRSREAAVTVAYWAIRGLAQPIRLLLEYTGTPYTDKKYEQGPAPDFDKSCWFDVKDTVLGEYPFPNLPYLIDGDLVVTQSNAIVRHLARTSGLLGSTTEAAARCDIMLEEGMDLRNRTVGMAYRPPGGDYDGALPAYEETLRAHLTKCSKYLGSSKWFAGDELTACDFVIYELLDQNALMVKGVLDAYSNLKDYHARFRALPEIAAYLASDRCIVFPCNNQHSHTTQKKLC